MNNDISPILGDWDYAPGELSVRKVEGDDGRSKIQIRMDLGLMQLEWDGRPDAVSPHGYSNSSSLCSIYYSLLYSACEET